MVAIAKLFIFATVASASLIARDAAQVLADLKVIDQKTKALTAKVNQYNGNINDAVPIMNAANDLDDYIKNTATPHAKSSPVVTPANAQKIIDYIIKTLEPDIKKAVNAVIAKKAKFVGNGLKAVVEQTLQKLKTDTNAYATVLVNKAPAAKKSGANAAKAKVLTDLQRGIDAFK